MPIIFQALNIKTYVIIDLLILLSVTDGYINTIPYVVILLDLHAFYLLIPAELILSAALIVFLEYVQGVPGPRMEA